MLRLVRKHLAELQSETELLLTLSKSTFFSSETNCRGLVKPPLEDTVPLIVTLFMSVSEDVSGLRFLNTRHQV